MPCLRVSFPTPRGSSRECLNLQLMASIPGTRYGHIRFPYWLPPGLLGGLCLVLGFRLKEQH